MNNDFINIVKTYIADSHNTIALIIFVILFIMLVLVAFFYKIINSYEKKLVE